MGKVGGGIRLPGVRGKTLQEEKKKPERGLQNIGALNGEKSSGVGGIMGRAQRLKGKQKTTS